MQNDTGMDPINKSQAATDRHAACPLCSNPGQAVETYTVEHLVKEAERPKVGAAQYRICLDQDCPVVYYSPETGSKFMQDQIQVPIWFKIEADPRYACYCSQVTVDQVREAVLLQGAKTVRDVNRLTGAMKNSNCRAKNPLGVCCHGIIQAAIDQALNGK